MLAGALLALAACSGNAAEEKAPEPVALVTLATAEPAQVQERVQLYGTADPGTAGSAILSSPQEAIVTAIEAPAGSAVDRGQVVVRLAPSPTARLDLVRAESDARAAQLAFARAQRLRADGLVSNAEVETARAAAQSATATRASLATRNAALALRSPVAGHVETIAAGAGSLVAAGAPVATIVKSGDLRARFGVDPALARRIGRGAAVRVTPSGGGNGFSVPVLAVDPFVDPQTRLASVFVRLPSAARIGAGEPLTGEIVIAGSSNAPTIPYAALLDEGGQSYVYVAAKGIAHRRDVTVGPTNGDRIAVLNGLRPGELVVVQGGTALEDGMKVRIK
jgi:membrane fusion protein (multidrug efflux system)